MGRTSSKMRRYVGVHGIPQCVITIPQCLAVLATRFRLPAAPPQAPLALTTGGQLANFARYASALRTAGWPGKVPNVLPTTKMPVGATDTPFASSSEVVPNC
jgi:hypothetical protein